MSVQQLFFKNYSNYIIIVFSETGNNTADIIISSATAGLELIELLESDTEEEVARYSEQKRIKDEHDKKHRLLMRQLHRTHTL